MQERKVRPVQLTLVDLNEQLETQIKMNDGLHKKLEDMLQTHEAQLAAKQELLNNLSLLSEKLESEIVDLKARNMPGNGLAATNPRRGRGPSAVCKLGVFRAADKDCVAAQ